MWQVRPTTSSKSASLTPTRSRSPRPTARQPRSRSISSARTMPQCSQQTRNLTETNSATDISSSGILTISDVDSPQTFVPSLASLEATGALSVDGNGAWTYTASSAHDELAAGQTYTDAFTVAAADGTTTSVTIYIAGTNDPALLSADTRNLTETNSAADISSSGTLTITDVDRARRSLHKFPRREFMEPSRLARAATGHMQRTRHR